MKQIGLGVILILAGLLLGRYLVPPEPPRPPTPTKTDTVQVEIPGPTVVEFRDRWNIRVDTTLMTRTVTEYDTIRVACADLTPKHYILGAVFGEEYGATTSVLTERVSFEGDSLTFQNTEEDIYTDGMPAHISIDSAGPTITWRDFPNPNSVSIFKKLEYGLIGAGAMAVILAVSP